MTTDNAIPDLTTDQMIEVDRAMMEDYNIGLIQMMENAGRNLAHLARDRFLKGNPRGKTIIVLAGSGGNGGGALVFARHLHNWGAKVEVHLSKDPKNCQGVPAHQLDIIQRMQIVTHHPDPNTHLPNTQTADLIIDGLIGYSLSGAPRGTTGNLIRWTNTQTAPVLSLDAPSGLDTTSGEVFDPAIKATATMTLALPKQGLRQNASVVGELYLADISVPPELYLKYLGLEVGPIFAESNIVRIP